MKPHAQEILVSVFASTDNGMKRPANEDAFIVADLTSGNCGLEPAVSTHWVGERGSLMVVSDGMGGAAGGEIASAMAVNTVRDELRNAGPASDVSDLLSRAVKSANKRIWTNAGQNPGLSGMGATLTAVFIQSASAYIAQVGDSRAYLIRGEQIKQLTKDQSLAQYLLEAGAIEPEQASSMPQNVILQALGTGPSVEVAITGVELCKNDYIVVCSDGLSNKVRPSEMREIAIGDGDLTTKCRRLIELANERGGEDNITVIVARFDGEALRAASDDGSITGSFKILREAGLVADPARISNEVRSPFADGANDPGKTLALSVEDLEAALLTATTEGGGDSEPVVAPAISQPPTGAYKESAYKKRSFPKGLIILATCLLLAAAAYFLYLYLAGSQP
jgi:serine/threonine protein phosphatase PrpC